MKKLILLTIIAISANIVNAQWQQTSGPGGGSILCLTSDGSTIFAGTYKGGVFLSIDSGSNWTAVNNGLTNLYVSSFVISGTNTYAGTRGGGVFLSTNNGSSWTEVNNGLTYLYVSSFVISGTNIFAGTDANGGGGVYLSIDSGSSWAAVNNGLTNFYVKSLTISGTNIFAGTFSGGVWKRLLSEMGGIEENKDNFHFIIYPNPTNGKFTISNIDNINSIEIYNVLGEIIYTTPNFKQQILNEIDLSEHPKGIYFVKIYNGAKTHTEKIMIQ